MNNFDEFNNELSTEISNFLNKKEVKIILCERQTKKANVTKKKTIITSLLILHYLNSVLAMPNYQCHKLQ